MYLELKINEGEDAMSDPQHHTWDPERYLAYASERGRPFLDLLARVGARAPRHVADLGAGPGNLTALLHARWPDAEVTAVDASPEMVEQARRVEGITPVLADLRTWEPAQPLDVIVSNAALQWVPDHLVLLDRLVGLLADGGWLAMQVPGNFDEPSHTIRRELVAQPAYAPHLAAVAVPSSHDAATYLRRLQSRGLMVDAWETTYLHVLTGPDPVFTWVSGTGARPTLQALPAELRADFEAEYRARLREAYPPDVEGRVVLPFRRVFAVAHAA